VNKYKSKLQRHVERFQVDLQQVQALVQQECKESLQLVEDSSKPLPSKDEEEVQQARQQPQPNIPRPDANIGEEETELSLQPEMLSPVITLKLMQQVMKRFTRMEDAMALLMAASKAKTSASSEQGIVGIDNDLLSSLTRDDHFYPASEMVT
jgi:hypothetical protein